MDKVKKFFGRIWEWIKETAWFQVLCLVGLVIGIVLSISPITKAISNAIEDGKQVKYFEKHRITYDELNTKVEDLTSGKSEEDFGVIFYNYTKTENKDLQKGLNNYANDFSNIAKKVYALDINCLSDNKSAYNDDKYFETYKVNKQQLFHLGQAFQDVYTDEYVDVINNDEKEVKQDSKEYEISDSTPIIENTLVWFAADGQPISSTKVNYENNNSSDITYPIKKVYTTIAYNRTDKDSLAVNNYTKGLIRFFDQEDLVG